MLVTGIAEKVEVLVSGRYQAAVERPPITFSHIFHIFYANQYFVRRQASIVSKRHCHVVHILALDAIFWTEVVLWEGHPWCRRFTQSI